MRALTIIGGLVLIALLFRWSPWSKEWSTENKPIQTQNKKQELVEDIKLSPNRWYRFDFNGKKGNRNIRWWTETSNVIFYLKSQDGKEARLGNNEYSNIISSRHTHVYIKTSQPVKADIWLTK